MNSKRAIEILNERFTQGIVVKGDDFLDALKLGLEALKRHQLIQQLLNKALEGFANPSDYLLPGETIEK